MSIGCPRCDHPAEVEEIPETAMQAGDVVVRVAGLARTRCREGHVEVVPAGARDVALDAVAGHLLAARTRGVVRRRAVCGDCDTDLVLPPVRTERVVPVDVEGRVLTITVGATMARCPGCGREQLTTEAAAAVPDVVRAAVDAARQ